MPSKYINYSSFFPHRQILCGNFFVTNDVKGIIFKYLNNIINLNKLGVLLNFIMK